MLTKNENELNELMRSREVNRDSRLYVLIVLKHESIYKLMIQWIKKNPSARQTEILKQTDKLRPEQPNSVAHTVSKTSRRIAKVAMF